MGWLRAVLRSLIGLFVDDAAGAAAIVLWLAVAWWLLPTPALPAPAAPAILFAGLAAILVVTAMRGARRGAKR